MRRSLIAAAFLLACGQAWAAFPTVTATNTTSVTAAATPAVINLPATVNADDVLIVFLRSASSGTHTYPGDWTVIKQVGTPDQTSVAYKQAVGNEDGTTINVTITSSKYAALSWSIAGATCVTTQAPEISAGGSGSSLTPDPDTVTPTGGAKDYLWLAMFAEEGENTLSTYPTNYPNNNITANTGAGGATTTNCIVGGAKRNDLNAASEDPGVFTLTSVTGADDYRAYTIAVHPGTGASCSGARRVMVVN